MSDHENEDWYLNEYSGPKPPSGTDGPTDGHTFRFEWSVRGSSNVEPGGPYRDSNYFSEKSVFEVRAWSLKQALEKAQMLSFSALQGFCYCPSAEVENGLCTRCEKPVAVGGGV